MADFIMLKTISCHMQVYSFLLYTIEFIGYCVVFRKVYIINKMYRETVYMAYLALKQSILCTSTSYFHMQYALSLCRNWSSDGYT